MGEGPKDLTLTCARGFVCPLLLLCLRSSARGVISSFRCFGVWPNPVSGKRAVISEEVLVLCCW